MNISIK